MPKIIKKGENGIPFQLHALTAYYIFLCCINKAGGLGEDNELVSGWSVKTKLALEKKIPKEVWEKDSRWEVYNKYLIDRYFEARRWVFKDNIPITVKGYRKDKFQILLLWLGIDDARAADSALIELYNKEKDNIFTLPLQTIELVLAGKHVIENQTEKVIPINVLFTAEPFGWLDLVRYTDKGKLYFYQNSDTIFDGDNKLLLKAGKIKTVDIHQMHGRPLTQWVKVGYFDNDQLLTAYFVEIVENGSELLPPGNLLKHFNDLKTV